MENKRLKNTLVVLAVYLAIMGLIFLFFPGFAENAFGIDLPDPALTPLFGQVLLVIAYLSYMISTDLEKFSKFVNVILFEQIGHIVVMAYLLIAGVQTFAQIGPVLIINTIFLILIWIFK